MTRYHHATGFGLGGLILLTLFVVLVSLCVCAGTEYWVTRRNGRAETRWNASATAAYDLGYRVGADEAVAARGPQYIDEPCVAADNLIEARAEIDRLRASNRVLRETVEDLETQLDEM